MQFRFSYAWASQKHMKGHAKCLFPLNNNHIIVNHYYTMILSGKKEDASSNMQPANFTIIPWGLITAECNAAE